MWICPCRHQEIVSNPTPPGRDWAKPPLSLSNGKGVKRRCWMFFGKRAIAFEVVSGMISGNLNLLKCGLQSVHSDLGFKRSCWISTNSPLGESRQSHLHWEFHWPKPPVFVLNLKATPVMLNCRSWALSTELSVCLGRKLRNRLAELGTTTALPQNGEQLALPPCWSTEIFPTLRLRYQGRALGLIFGLGLSRTRPSRQRPFWKFPVYAEAIVRLSEEGSERN